MHVSAGILVNTVASGLGEGKQLRNKTYIIASQQFNVPKAFCVMNVNQTTKHTEKNHFCSFTDLLDLIYTRLCSVILHLSIQLVYLNTVRLTGKI